MTLHLRVRRQGELARLCGMEVESIEPYPSVSRVPGSGFGMALVRSQIVPVLRLGDANTCLIVGRVRGEVFGVVGLQVVGFETEDAPESRVSCSPTGVATWRASASFAPSNDSDDLEVDVEALVAEVEAQQRPTP